MDLLSIHRKGFSWKSHIHSGNFAYTRYKCVKYLKNNQIAIYITFM